ncbi:hypothetical protein ACWOFR_04330 [Carnobacterium gallinarum]|uniref:hypothetical protein n=1 Tax=Carnobacterium gallinarum TaxID=2749 RepID=UPI000554B587|nr:hypothetical protein [Carnobacterium gallinarum]
MSSHFRKEYFCDWLMVNEGLILEEDCVKESVDILLHEELPFILQSIIRTIKSFPRASLMPFMIVMMRLKHIFRPSKELLAKLKIV